MIKKTLRTLYEEHQGKVSDKWSIYLAEYDIIFATYRDDAVRLLEIGIQNGGSLDIWSKYFPKAKKLVGCDINPDCAKLAYDDQRISIIIGDANNNATEAAILSATTSYDLIIDDGSHRSSDIIKSFAKYWPHLVDGGVYVVEDLHCSYWESYEGGIYDPLSSMAFFKRLTDVLNFEHWGLNIQRSSILKGLSAKYDLDIDENSLVHLHSIEFINSLCIIKKRKPVENVLGNRIFAGTIDDVIPGHIQLCLSASNSIDESGNFWSIIPLPPDEAYFSLTADIKSAKDQISSQNNQLRELNLELAESRTSVVKLNNDITDNASRFLILDKLLSEKIDSLCLLDERLALRDEQLLAAKAQMSKINQQLHASNLALAEATLKFSEINKNLSLMEEYVAFRDSKILSINAQFNENIALLHNSSSWRVTAPLRFVSRQIKRAPVAIKLILPAIKLGGGIGNTVFKALNLYKRDGIPGIKRGFRLAAVSTTPPLPPAVDAALKSMVERNDYTEWVHRYDTLADADRGIMRVHQSKFVQQPVISVLMPSCSAEPEWLSRVIESLKSQIYPHWELCIADNSGANSNARRVLECNAAQDARIKTAFFPQSGNAAELTKHALDLATGTWLALLGPDDLLTENALFWIAHTANQNHSVQLIYADEDKIDIAGKRYDPYFKCDWNVDLFYSQNMLGHLAYFQADLVRQIGGYRDNFGFSKTYDLVLRYIEHIKPEQIEHIPRVLHHQGTQIKFTSGSSLVLSQQTAATVPNITGVQALNEHFQRMGIKASAEISAQSYRVRYSLPDVLPLVTIIIPTRNGLTLLRQCIDSIASKTTYSNYEILIIDNGSDDPETLDYLKSLAQKQRFMILRDDGPFNYSALNNAAVKTAKGELVALVNNDIEVITPDWLSEMVAHALRKNVGAVGARLWYPNDTLQHAGVILGCHGLAGHLHKNLAKNEAGYFNRANVVQDFSAITAACLVVKKSLFEEVGGFNEKDLCIAFNDVDLCAKLQAAGYRNLWTPYAELYHHESATRGPDDANQATLERTAKEAGYIQRNWFKLLAHDPAYSPNLSIEHEDCSLAWPPRVAKLSPPKPVAGTLHKHYLFLTYRMTLGWGVDVAVANIAQQMIAMGYKVTIGCLDKDDFYNGLDIVVLKNDPHSVDELINKIGCDCVVAHTSPFFEMLPKLSSATPKWAMEYGDPTPEFFPLDGKERSHIKHDKMINCYPFVDGVIGISKFIRSDIQWPSAKTVYMGCDHAPDRGPKSLFDFDQRPEALLKVGTLMRLGKGESHYKGNQLFLELVAKCKKENKTTQFFVMGRGTPEDAHFFESMGIEVHLNAPDDKKWDYLRALDIFISPSQWEGFNLPLAEAQALGTIGLAFDTGAHPEVTPHIVSSVDEAAALIQQMAQNKTLLLQESALAYRFVRNQFSWKKSAVDLLQITSGN